MRHLRAFLPLLVLVAVGLVLLATGTLDRFAPDRIAARQAELHALVASRPVSAALVQIVAIALAIATGLPGAIVLVFAGGMVFGVIYGTALSTIGTTLGAIGLFLASRSAFRHGFGHAPTLVEKLRDGYQTHPVSYTMFLRLVPFFPFGAVTIALAWLRCPLVLFVGATAIGGAIMVAFETALGAGLATTIAHEGTVSFGLLTHRRVVLPLVGMALLALTPVVLGRIRRRSRRTP